MQRGAKAVLTCIGVGVGLMAVASVQGGTKPAPVTAVLGGPAPVTLAPVATAEPADTAGIGPGRWEIGTDLAPGKYRSTGPDQDVFPLCTWIVEKPGGGFVDAGTTQGPATYTVPNKPGYLFQTSGCARWVKA